jgi:hypothetical protein
MIMKRLISGCGMTTSMMIACIPIILLPKVSYAEDSFPEHFYVLCIISKFVIE